MRLLLEIALVAIAAIGAAVCVALLPDRSSIGRQRVAAPQPSRPKQLLQLERLVSMATVNALQVHAYVWEIVRPNRPFPEDRHGPGVSTGDLQEMVEVLERL